MHQLASSLPFIVMSSLATGCETPDAPRVDAPETLPDAAPDAASDSADQLPACARAQASYTGTLFRELAVEGNPQMTSGHFLGFYGDLDASSRPDQIQAIAFYAYGVGTGTFTLPDSNWSVELCTEFQESQPPCQDRHKVASGTLSIMSVAGRLVGKLENAVFVDDRALPTCATSVGTVSFDAPIECRPQAQCP